LSSLAINGGPKAVTKDPGDIFVFPRIDERDEKALLDMLHSRQMSSAEAGREFGDKYAQWQGTKYGLATNTGTAAITSCFYGVGIGCGDEVIVPSFTYWASVVPLLILRAVPVFADIDPMTLTIDPNDIEHRITPRTKAIMVVHLYSHPADMDPIMEIAERHGLYVIEDVSQAHGALYKGRMVGSIGHVSGASVMTGKALPAGEGGVLCTNDQEIFERAIVFGHYVRIPTDCKMEKYKRLAGLSLGGVKYRMNGFSAAMALVQLEKFPKLLPEYVAASKLWWDLVKDIPGIIPHYPRWENSDRGGGYAPHGIYDVQAAPNNLPLKAFARAVEAEGVQCALNAYYPTLHMHPAFQDVSIYGEDKPTCIAYAERDVRLKPEDLPHTVAAHTRVYSVPRFCYCDEEYITQCANAYRKVMEHADEVPVLPEDYEFD